MDASAKSKAAEESNQSEEDDEGNWVTVVKKGRKPQLVKATQMKPETIRRGTNTSQHALKVKPVARQMSFFSSKWPLYVEVADVAEYFKNAHALDAVVTPVLTRAESYKCFRVVLTLTDINIAFEPDFWPERVVFRKYHYRANESSGRGNTLKVGDKKLESDKREINKTVDPLVDGQENKDNDTPKSNLEGVTTAVDYNNDNYESCTDDDEVTPLRLAHDE